MNDPRIPRIVYGFLLAIGVLDWVRRYPLLPARMASHFGPHGEVTNWQSKERFFMTMVAVVGVSFVAGVCCSAVDWGAPREHGESAAQGILVSRGTARRDDAISEHENGMVCLRGAVLASVRDFGSNQREHAIAWTV